jgi:tetratricopeptide (TPR) repeat protein
MDHPTRETLEGFLRSSLPAHQVKTTLAHLLSCDRCKQDMEPLAAVMWNPDAALQPVLSPEEDAAYEDSISAAFAFALGRERELGSEKEAAERKVAAILHNPGHNPNRTEALLSLGSPTWGLCEVLLDKSRELRQTDRPAMLRLSALACDVADRLDPAVYGREQRADLQARVWAELANAWRLSDDLSQAEAAMACARDLRLQGTGDPLLFARIADLRASLLSDQRRFAESFRMLDAALAVHERYGDPHEAGRLTIMKGLYKGYAGDPEEGLQLLARGLSLVDRERDDKLVFHALHNILLLRVELGDFEEAGRQLEQMRPLYAAEATWLDLVKLSRIEGQIAAGLGRFDEAEALFMNTREELDRAGFGYEASLVSLNLAEVRLLQGKTAQVRRLVAELVMAFRVLGVEREAMVAVVLLRDAVEHDQVTLEVLRQVAGALWRLPGQPPSRAGFDEI